MNEINSVFKKISYPKKCLIILLAFILTFLVSILPKLQFIFEGKIYLTSSEIEIELDNKHSIYTDKKELSNIFYETLNTNIYSDTVILKTINDLGMVDENGPDSNITDIAFKIKNRIEFSKDENFDFKYYIQIKSVEPKKSTIIVNTLAQNIKILFYNNFIEFIEKIQQVKINELLSLNDINYKIENKEDFELIKSELIKRNKYNMAMLKILQPKLEIKPAEIPKISYYPDEDIIDFFTIAGLYHYLSVILILILIIIVTANIFESRKEYKIRKSKETVRHIS